MKKFLVTKTSRWDTVIEAESAEEAIDIADGLSDLEWENEYEFEYESKEVKKEQAK